MYIGIHTYNHNKKSKINKVFMLLCISYAIWSFAYAFAYVSYDSYVFSFWNKISALGWCSFSAITLYLVLLITENKMVHKKIVQVILFSPAFLFWYMAIFMFGVEIDTPPIISNVFYIGDFLYNFIYLLMSILLVFLWGVQSDRYRVKKQSRILVNTSIIPFCLNLIMQWILPVFGVNQIPLMGQLFAVIMIIGIFVVIEKYNFLRIPEKVVFEEVENKIIDMVAVVNEKGEIIKISDNTLHLLDMQRSELFNQNITVLFDEHYKEKFSLNNLKKEIRYNDIKIIKHNGEGIPVNINCIPIWDNKIHDFLGAAIVMQDISIEYELRRKNEELHEKTIRDGLTNLYNHQYSVDIIKKEIIELDEVHNKKTLSLMMIDIDYFKRVNDTYGHLFGDYVLKTVSNILTTIINNDGYVGRFGGEEFIIILPVKEIEEAYKIAEKIRSEIENTKFEEDLKLTVSIGLKQYKNQFYIDFVKETDDLLYKAKQNGRNRIECNL